MLLYSTPVVKLLPGAASKHKKGAWAMPTRLLGWFDCSEHMYASSVYVSSMVVFY